MIVLFELWTTDEEIFLFAGLLQERRGERNN